MFANCCCVVHTRQLEFANTSLLTLDCCVNAALTLARDLAMSISDLQLPCVCVGHVTTRVIFCIIFQKYRGLNFVLQNI